MGITFYPKMFMSEEIPSDQQREAFLKKSRLNLYSLDYDRAHGVLGIGYHKSHYISRATKEFIRIAKEKIHYSP